MAKLIDAYTGLVEKKSVLDSLPQANDTEKKLVAECVQKFKESLDTTDEEGLQNLMYGVYGKATASTIYAVCNQLRMDARDAWEGNGCGIPGLDFEMKLNVFLFGDTSAGKTTFLSRLFGEDVGGIKAIPTTAFSVIHRYDNLRSLQINFSEQFKITDERKKEDFQNFMAKYGLNPFMVHGNDFILRPDEEFYLKDSYSTKDYSNFIEDANKYPEAFDEIIWTHKKKKELTFMDFANFYDMPGTGGLAEHSANIKKTLQSNVPDIVLYFVKTDKGVPGDEAYKTLRELLDTLSENLPLLFFVYQKKDADFFGVKFSNDKELVYDDYVTKENGIRKQLFDWINLDLSEEKQNELKTASFTEKQKKYLSKMAILDVRGGKDEHDRVNLAMSLVLDQVFGNRFRWICRNAEYIENSHGKIEVIGELTELDRKKIAIIEKGMREDNYGRNPLLEEAIDNFRASYNKTKKANGQKSSRNVFDGILRATAKSIASKSIEFMIGESMGYTEAAKESFREFLCFGKTALDYTDPEISNFSEEDIDFMIKLFDDFNGRIDTLIEEAGDPENMRIALRDLKEMYPYFDEFIILLCEYHRQYLVATGKIMDTGVLFDESNDATNVDKELQIALNDDMQKLRSIHCGIPLFQLIVDGEDRQKLLNS